MVVMMVMMVAAAVVISVTIGRRRTFLGNYSKCNIILCLYPVCPMLHTLGMWLFAASDLVRPHRAFRHPASPIYPPAAGVQGTT